MLDDEYNDFEEMNDSKDITIPPLKKINHEKKEKKNKNKKISIEDIDGKKIKNVKITSPRTKAAMIKLGYIDEDLNYLTFKEFIEKNPNLRGLNKEIKKNRYEYIINLREKRINEIKELREKINPDELSSQYSLIKKSNNNSKIDSNNSKYKSTAIENQKKEFERLKNKNEIELLGMVQYELKRELLKKEAEDKIEQDKIRKEKYEKDIMKKRKKEEKLRKEKEKEEEKKQKELENYQKKLERERYEE